MNIQVGVKLLIKNDKGKFLFIQRNTPLPDGTGIKWDIPGGRINPGESLKDALKREVMDILIPDADLHVVRLTYATSLDKEVVLGDEHQAMRWHTLKEAADIDVDPYLRDVLDSL